MRKARFPLVLFLASIAICGYAHAFRGAPESETKAPVKTPVGSDTNAPPVSANAASVQAPAEDQAKTQEGDSSRNRENEARFSRWLQGYPGVITFLGSFIALLASIYFFLKTRSLSVQLADRTVRIEAQKLLLEINKQFVTNPALLAIYDEHFEKLPFEKRNSSDFKLSLRAIALMKLNVFEIVFAVHPTGSERGPWEEYFRDSLKTCSPLREVLDKYNYMYSHALIEAYRAVTKDFPSQMRCSSLENIPPRISTPATVWTRLGTAMRSIFH